ncbi:MAG: TIGR03663 family protein [Blastocatellia bacterium]
MAYLLAVAVAIFLRFYWLELKPLHHDEGVNSYFLLNLADRWDYHYDPTNYHGPSLYYFVLVVTKILGRTDFALRAFPALCGVLTVAWMWGLRRGLGLVGMPVAAWSLALCPGLVYYSRDFIHESSFGFFTVGMIVAAYNWRKPYNLIVLAIFTGLLFVTKETSIHTVVVLVLAVGCAYGWDMVRRRVRGETILWPPFSFLGEQIAKSFVPFVLIFLSLYIVFYTSFFTNLKGPVDFLRSVFMWTGRGVKEGIHDHAFTYYLGILIKLELPLVLAAIVGAVVTLWRGRRFGLFTMAWAFGMFLGYSVIPYKTPWLMVSMLIALAVFSGTMAQEIFSALRFTAPQLAFVALLLAVAAPVARTSWQVNFVNYEDNENHTAYFRQWGERWKLRPYTDTQYGYVYAQTDKDLLNLVQEIYRLKPAAIYIASPDYWPLPWYLRNYEISGYAQEVPENFTGPALIAAAAQREDAEKKLPGYQVREFALRPGVNLLWFVKAP